MQACITARYGFADCERRARVVVGERLYITRLSAPLLTQRGSRGSRLHRDEADILYGYAQWPCAAARSAAFSGVPRRPGGIPPNAIVNCQDVAGRGA